MRRTLLAILALLAVHAHAQHEHEGHGEAPMPEPAPGAVPPGHAEITIPEDRVQLIGMRTAKARLDALGGTVRASAIVLPDERKEVHVHPKVMGWVEELFVDAVGQQVAEGDPLYSIYSQELFAAQQDYLRARRFGGPLAAAARARLQSWDVPADQLRLIERKGAQRAIVFRSPAAGTVIEKAVVRGHFVEPGTMLYRLADLTEVWLMANAYEFEVNRIARGAVAKVEVQGIPVVLEARVDDVYPTVDETSRSVKVRLVMPNLGGLLRPGSFATVEISTVATKAVWVPDEAIVDTGRRQVVYLALGNGRFRPVIVIVGRRAQGRAEILSGLRGGEDVVVGAQFLIDSESRLRGLGDAPSGHSGHGG